jgi:hypothetical protein
MIDYHQVLADLEARRASVVADLDASIRTVRQILQAGGQQPQFRVVPQGQVNNTKTVFDFLVSQGPKALSPKTIAEGTGLAESAVRGIVNRLSKGKKAKIERPSRGKYRAKPQAQEISAGAAA